MSFLDTEDENVQRRNKSKSRKHHHHKKHGHMHGKACIKGSREECTKTYSVIEGEGAEIPDERKFPIKASNGETICYDVIELYQWIREKPAEEATIVGPAGTCQVSEELRNEIIARAEELGEKKEQETTFHHGYDYNYYTNPNNDDAMSVDTNEEENEEHEEEYDSEEQDKEDYDNYLFYRITYPRGISEIASMYFEELKIWYNQDYDKKRNTYAASFKVGHDEILADVDIKFDAYWENKERYGFMSKWGEDVPSDFYEMKKEKHYYDRLDVKITLNVDESNDDSPNRFGERYTNTNILVRFIGEFLTSKHCEAHDEIKKFAEIEYTLTGVDGFKDVKAGYMPKLIEMYFSQTPHQG